MRGKAMNDGATIERLSAAYDRWFSQHSLGGMYDFTDYREPNRRPKTLIPGKTDAFGNKITKEDEA